MVEKEMSFMVDTNLFKRHLTESFVELGTTNDKITLICTKDKISVTEPNISNVVMLNVEFNNNMLENYTNNFEDDEELALTILVSGLNTKLQSLSGKSKFVLDSKKQKINISSGIYKYGIGLKTQDTKHRNIPNIPYENTVNLIGENFFTMIEKCSKVDAFINLQLKHELLDKNNFLLNIYVSEKESNDDLNIEIDKFNMLKSNIQEECNVSLDIINTDFLKVLKVTGKNAPDIKLNIKNDVPLLIEYNIPDNKGTVKLMIAPRSE